MGEVERLTDYFDKGNKKDLLGRDDAEAITKRLPEVEQEIRQTWERYKTHMLIRHGIRLEDNGLRMILVWLMSKGVA